jgi:2-aminoethylphosphonate-pyruvate transaminase
MKEILLNPGPVNLSPRVRDALLKADLCHREREFSDLQTDIRSKLTQVYNLDNHWAAILLTGSGTSAMEAMMSSVIPVNSKVLVVENGVYGERLSKICSIHEIPYQTMHHEWGQAVDLARLEQSLTSDIAFVAVVHHETTTGRLNDLHGIATLCKEKNIPILLDGVSSFAAEEISFNDWNIIACAATANKCVHGIPGASFVIVQRDALQSSGNPARTLYLNLQSYLEQQDKGATPFTQSVQSFYALNEALNEHSEHGGWMARRELYRERMNSVIKHLHELDIKSLLPIDESSCVLHTFLLPDGMTYTTLHDELKARGFIIYAGQGQYADSIFRISLMGDITDNDIERLNRAFSEILC